MVVVAAYGTADETWSFDGIRWLKSPAGATPTVTSWLMSGDADGSTILLLDLSTPAQPGKVWIWAGTTWIRGG
jgi:hypothetical protein